MPRCAAGARAAPAGCVDLTPIAIVVFGGQVRATGVQLKTTGGKVIVDHVTGQADVGGNRDIRVRQVDGGAVVKKHRRDSWVGEFVGDLRANSANGHITVNVARAAVNAHTSNGDIRVGELGSGTVGLYTTGEVEVGIPQGIAARLDVHTSTGQVRNYLEAPTPPRSPTEPSRCAPVATAVTSSSTAPDPAAAPSAPSLEPSHAVFPLP